MKSMLYTIRHGELRISGLKTGARIFGYDDGTITCRLDNGLLGPNTPGTIAGLKKILNWIDECNGV